MTMCAEFDLPVGRLDVGKRLSMKAGTVYFCSPVSCKCHFVDHKEGKRTRKLLLMLSGVWTKARSRFV